MPGPQIKATCSLIAQNAGPQLGLDWQSILQLVETLLPLVVQCLPLILLAETPKQYVQSHYDSTTQQFDGEFMGAMRRHGRKAARRTGHQDMTPADLDVISVATGHQIMASSDEMCSAVIAECAAA